MDLQHQQRDDDRKRPVAERFEPRGLRQTDFMATHAFPRHGIAFRRVGVRPEDEMID